MTQSDLIALMERVIVEKGKGGQAQLARELGCSDSAVSQIRKGTYDADPAAILRKFAVIYSTDIVVCPVLGDITYGICAEEKGKGYSGSRYRLWRACKQCGGKR